MIPIKKLKNPHNKNIRKEFLINQQLKDELRRIADKQECSESEIIRKALLNYFNKMEGL